MTVDDLWNLSRLFLSYKIWYVKMHFLCFSPRQAFVGAICNVINLINHLNSANHCAWHDRFCLAKAVFGNTNVLSGQFGFSLTMSVSILLEDLLGTSAAVVPTGLGSFATFELVLTGLKKPLILCFFVFFNTISSTSVFTTITSVSKRIDFFDFV